MSNESLSAGDAADTVAGAGAGKLAVVGVWVPVLPLLEEVEQGVGMVRIGRVSQRHVPREKPAVVAAASLAAGAGAAVGRRATRWEGLAHAWPDYASVVHSHRR